MTTISRSSFWFVRHGQTDWNKANRIMGQTDIPLNEHGIAQAHAAADRLKEKSFEMIFASPLQRALQTAEIIAQKTNKAIMVMEHFKECHWGRAEGQNRDSLEFEKWQKHGIDGAESYANFTHRIKDGMEQVLALQEPILIVAHSGVYAIVQEILRLEREDVANAVPLFHYHHQDQWMVKAE